MTSWRNAMTSSLQAMSGFIEAPPCVWHRARPRWSAAPLCLSGRVASRGGQAQHPMSLEVRGHRRRLASVDQAGAPTAMPRLRCRGLPMAPRRRYCATCVFLEPADVAAPRWKEGVAGSERCLVRCSRHAARDEFMRSLRTLSIPRAYRVVYRNGRAGRWLGRRSQVKVRSLEGTYSHPGPTRLTETAARLPTKMR